MSTPDTADATVFHSGGKMRAAGWTATVLAGIFIILATGYSIMHSANGENLHLLQAEAFLNGRASIQQQLNDTAVFDGKV
ncbi:MAG: hypothetical protein KAT47_03215, partial [Candidatus Aegiribacteria sp.]|nr:hypothetical protein [Candidatus Aegiribacteria sp.]